MILFQIGSGYLSQAARDPEELTKTATNNNDVTGHKPYEDIDAALGIVDLDQPRLIEFLFCMGWGYKNTFMQI